MSKQNPSNTDVIEAVDFGDNTDTQQDVKAKAQKLNYFQMILKHQPNYNSIIGSNLLLMSSGIHMAWGLWQIGIQPTWALCLSQPVYQFILCSWFLTAIVGIIVGSIILNIWKKAKIYSICGVLLAISGILYIAWFNDYMAILFGRLIGGFVHGILYVSIVSHYAENSAAQMRGRIVSNIGVILNGSAVFVTLFNFLDWDIFTIESSYSIRLVGIFVLVFAVLGFTLNYFLTVESVQFLMERDQKHEAVAILMKLRNETSSDSLIITREINQIEQMMSQANEENRNIFKNENIRPLIAIVIVKVITFLTNNAIINTMIVRAVQIKLEDHTMLFVAPLVFTCARLFFGFVPLLCGDYLTRKRLLSFGAISGIFLAAYSFMMMTEPILCPYPGGFVILLACFQMALGFGADPVVHVITSEAFAINKKRLSIASTTIIEYVLQLIAMITVHQISADSEQSMYGLMLGTAIVLQITGVTMNFVMPITNNLSLKYCRDVYRKCWKRAPKKPKIHESSDA